MKYQKFVKDNSTVYELPHARVTLTKLPKNDVEIEVWPKQGQSSYAVIPGFVAEVIGAQLIAYSAPESDVPDNVVQVDFSRGPKKNA